MLESRENDCMTVKVHVEAVRLLTSHETACKGLSVSAQACRGHGSAQRGCENTSRVRLSAHRGRASANKQCPVPGQVQVKHRTVCSVDKSL